MERHAVAIYNLVDCTILHHAVMAQPSFGRVPK